MSLIEQRASYMHRLQMLIDARQKDIDEKVGALRAKLEAEQIQPYRAQLEAKKVTLEMNKLIEFINNIDAMLAYENTVNTSTDTVEQTSETKEQVEVKQNADASVEQKEVKENTETFHGDAHDNTAGNLADAVPVNSEHVKTAEALVGTSFDAIAADLADTKAKLQSVAEGRPGMPGIVLPRR